MVGCGLSRDRILKMFKIMIPVFLICICAYSAFAANSRAANQTCPSQELCPKFIATINSCSANHKSKSCDDFVNTFRKLTPRFDCQRSFDTNPVPAVWLCDEGADGDPKPFEKARLCSN